MSESADDPDTVDDNTEVAYQPNDIADSAHVIEAKIPDDVRRRYEVFSYRNAAVIFSESWPHEFEEIINALHDFQITTAMIRTAGGNESEIPKILSDQLRPKDWHETTIRGDLLVSLSWKVQTGVMKSGRLNFEKHNREVYRRNYLDGQKIDYVKNKVTFELDWNSKDQIFDRDLYLFSVFAQTGAIDVGVLLTHGTSLNALLRNLGPALGKYGMPEIKRSGAPRMTHEKFGASTTWMGKLLYRLNAGRNGSCPVLAFGITPLYVSNSPQ